MNDQSALRTRDLVSRLQQSDIFRDYQDAFQTTTGLPLVLRAIGSFQTPLSGSKQANAFCVLMASRNKSCSACLQFQQSVEQETGQEAKTLECFAGLSDTAVPIRVGDQIVAYLQTGQVFLRAPSRARFKKTLEQLAEWGVDLDRDQLETAYFKTRVLGKPHYESVVRLLSIFAEHLATITNQLMVQDSFAESPTVEKARAFIAAHLSEEMSLPLIAHAVNMSPFYFCKIFKKETGLTLTDYVSRIRIEAVKQLLLNPHKRVSEAAYEAGFQSLSQFNRTFRRVASESPSAYRERLHGKTPADHNSPTLAHAA